MISLQDGSDETTQKTDDADGLMLVWKPQTGEIAPPAMPSENRMALTAQHSSQERARAHDLILFFLKNDARNPV